jgi:hypothetical protein
MTHLPTLIAETIRSHSDEWDGLNWETDLTARSSEELGLSPYEHAQEREREKQNVEHSAAAWALDLYAAAKAARTEKWNTCLEKFLSARRHELHYGDCPATNAVEQAVLNVVSDWCESLCGSRKTSRFRYDSCTLEHYLDDFAHGVLALVPVATGSVEPCTSPWATFESVEEMVAHGCHDDEAEDTWQKLAAQYGYFPAFGVLGPLGLRLYELWTTRRSRATYQHVRG